MWAKYRLIGGYLIRPLQIFFRHKYNSQSIWKNKFLKTDFHVSKVYHHL